MSTTTIEWAGPPGYLPESWNPIRARYGGQIGWHCEKVSPGCQHCYSERQNRCGRGKYGGTKLGYTADSPAEVYLDEKVLEQPLHWRKPRCVFVCSMSDLFGGWVSDDMLHRIFGMMATAIQHRFLVLTKRPEAMTQWCCMSAAGYGWRRWPPPNVGFGVTVEGPEYLGRVATLSEIPAAMRFVSCEPLLEAIDCKGMWNGEQRYYRRCGYVAATDEPCEFDRDTPDDPDEEWAVCPECGNTNSGGFESYTQLDIVPHDDRPFPNIDWIIAGGESGPGARPAHQDWFRSLRDQCQAAGVPFFFKQWGEHFPASQLPPDRYLPWAAADSQIVHEDGEAYYRVGKKNAGRLLDGRTWDEWPEPFFA